MSARNSKSGDHCVLKYYEYQREPTTENPQIHSTNIAGSDYPVMTYYSKCGSGKSGCEWVLDAEAGTKKYICTCHKHLCNIHIGNWKTVT